MLNLSGKAAFKSPLAAPHGAWIGPEVGSVASVPDELYVVAMTRLPVAEDKDQLVLASIESIPVRRYRSPKRTD